ncbi:hypothetical protein [Leptospira kirschneri]|uniref:hypothetical protein n=1 Tax=Leptospira kirschneri TaxID=29507 RepID=UPI000347DC7A|nr:hypothetical protein [Leptospira kirschneri]KPZ76139.1 hypothetical protein APS47_17490 [Leptospira kirschneri serovar Mozdok]
MGFQWLPAEFQSASFANKGRNLYQAFVPLWTKLFQSASFANKGRNLIRDLIRLIRKCFNPLPLRTKEETAAQKPRKNV